MDIKRLRSYFNFILIGITLWSGCQTSRGEQFTIPKQELTMNLPYRRDPVPKQNQPDDEYLKRLASLKEAVGETSYFTSEQLVNAKTKYQDMQNKLAGAQRSKNW